MVRHYYCLDEPLDREVICYRLNYRTLAGSHYRLLLGNESEKKGG